MFLVQSGEGTPTHGGSPVAGKTTAPNETRAPPISGGMDKKAAAGDAATIPAKRPAK